MQFTKKRKKRLDLSTYWIITTIKGNNLRLKSINITIRQYQNCCKKERTTILNLSLVEINLRR